MPELPEVETIRRQLLPELIGRRFVEAWGFDSPKFDSAPTATGARVDDISRRGKYLLIELEARRELVIHLGMTGVLRIRTDAEIAAQQDPYVRAWWRLDSGDVFEFRDVRRFGRVSVVAAGAYETMPTLHDLGPEPFDDQWTGADLYVALKRSKARVKTQLLSQRPVAGVGNIYADEALWRSEIHPARRSITKLQAERLRIAIRDVLEASLDNGGTTLRDYRTVEGGTGDNQYHLDCYGRAGEPCRRCGDELRSRVYDARTTTFCPTCQVN